jgi:hypothetical protein
MTDDVDRFVVDDDDVLTIKLDADAPSQGTTDARVITFDAGVDDRHGHSGAAPISECPVAVEPPERSLALQLAASAGRERGAPGR